ncbi:hypothetical protein [Mesorhizobium sp.]|uniref:hypothetical protein n=1 Tax=Mesorhizobium sp. TaxID=1871066 RepID=UPI0025803E4C|nr:hypothetical protein [Mesorhizobium sp.]
MVIAFFRAAPAFEHPSLAAFRGGIPATGRGVTEAVAFAVDFSLARGDSPFNLNRA